MVSRHTYVVGDHYRTDRTTGGRQSAKICRRMVAVRSAMVGDGRRPPHGGRRQSQGDRLINADLWPTGRRPIGDQSATNQRKSDKFGRSPNGL